jgi:hypothetical protein
MTLACVIVQHTHALSHALLLFVSLFGLPPHFGGTTTATTTVDDWGRALLFRSLSPRFAHTTH